MQIRIKFASGREVELSSDEIRELAELFKNGSYFQPIPNPFIQPMNPYPWGVPVITCATGVAT